MVIVWRAFIVWREVFVVWRDGFSFLGDLLFLLTKSGIYIAVARKQLQMEARFNESNEALMIARSTFCRETA